MYKRIDKWITTLFLKPIIQWYLKRDTWYKNKWLPGKLLIKNGVFHPAFFFSSEFLAEFAHTLPLKQTRVCEMCAGSGLLSFVALSKKAIVSSVDISDKAIQGLKFNAQHLFPTVPLEIIQSDGFSKVPRNTFDYIFLNPPYFFKDPSSDADYAWYCGANGRFFEDFFSALPMFTHAQSKVFMVLADNCEVDRIKAIAHRNNWDMIVINSREIRWEINTIFQIFPR